MTINKVSSVKYWAPGPPGSYAYVYILQCEVIYPSMLKPRAVQITEIFRIIEQYYLYTKWNTFHLMHSNEHWGVGYMKIWITEIWISKFQLYT